MNYMPGSLVATTEVNPLAYLNRGSINKKANCSEFIKFEKLKTLSLDELHQFLDRLFQVVLFFQITCGLIYCFIEPGNLRAE